MTRDPDSGALLASIFRTVHTIKGTSGFLAFGRLEELTHAGETLLARLRDRELTLTPAVGAVLRELTDTVRALLARIAETGSDRGPDIDRVLSAVRTAAADGPYPEPAGQPANGRPEQLGGSLTRVGEPSVRVSVGLLDDLLALAGELAQARRELAGRLGRTRAAAAGADHRRAPGRRAACPDAADGAGLVPLSPAGSDAG